MSDATIAHPQWFPAYYSASGRFRDQNGQETGAAGARLILTFDFPTRPHALLALRVVNLWSIPDVAEWADEQGASSQAVLDYIRGIDDAQSIRTQFTQSDIVVRPTAQRTVIGGGNAPHVIHWHPLACPYYLRGGNKVVVELERLVSYPTLVLPDEQELEIIPTVHCTWETVVGVEGAAYGGRDWGVPTFGMMPGGPGAGG